MEEILSVGQVAREVDRDPSTVRQWCRDGTIQAQHTAAGYIVTRSEVDRLKRNPPLRGVAAVIAKAEREGRAPKREPWQMLPPRERDAQRKALARARRAHR